MANYDPVIDHLTPFHPGQSGNPNGRPKGRKSLVTIIRELEQEDFNWKVVPMKGEDSTIFAENIGSPWRAIVIVALQQALQGSIPAMEWLRRAGYSDKIDITNHERRIERPVIISEIRSRDLTSK